MGKIDYLKQEINKAWERIIKLEGEVKELLADPEAVARQASKMTTQYRNRAEQKASEAEDLVSQITALQQASQEAHNSATDSAQRLSGQSQKANSEYAAFREKLNRIQTDSDLLEEIGAKYPNLQQDVDDLAANCKTADETVSNIEQVYTAANKRLEEIRALHREIHGVPPDEENDTTEVPGLKHDLEVSYESLVNRQGELEEDHANFLKKVETKYDEVVEKWKARHDEQMKSIKSLLPNALTAGLSYAYSDKKTEEEKVLKSHSRAFSRAILGLVLISFLPFGVSVAFFLQGNTLAETIVQSPQLAWAILPLYAPVLWFAYSASKKAKLSKRLIEEYTHKEVLSRTYEGLAAQVEDIENEEMAVKLRLKLLINILNISSENPGKLISDYNKSDHPVMEALDKSLEFSDSLERMTALPGISQLVKLVDRRSEKIKRSVSNKVENAIGSLDAEGDSPTSS